MLLRMEACSHGILVARVGAITFEVALSPGITFGTTRELDLL